MSAEEKLPTTCASNATAPSDVPGGALNAWQVCELAQRNGLVPKQYDTPAKLFVAVEYLRQLGVPPLVHLPNVALINGMPTACRDLPLILARRHPLWDEARFREEILYDDKGVPVGAVCQVARKGCEPVVRKFTRDDALRARLLTKSGPWQEYPGRMYQLRARAWALRDAFTDALSGTVIAEEMIGVEE